MFGWFGKVSFVPFSKIQDFAVHLKDGRMMGSRCTSCGRTSFPPRADCPACMSGEFELQEVSGKGTLYTYTRIDAAPSGFEDVVPFTIAVVDLEEGGRLLGWLGETIDPEKLDIGMPVQVVPRLFEDIPEIRVHYTVERPGTTWSKAPVS